MTASAATAAAYPPPLPPMEGVGSRCRGASSILIGLSISRATEKRLHAIVSTWARYGDAVFLASLPPLDADSFADKTWILPVHGDDMKPDDGYSSHIAKCVIVVLFHFFPLLLSICHLLVAAAVVVLRFFLFVCVFFSLFFFSLLRLRQ